MVQDNAVSGESAQRFMPHWEGCSGLFNEGSVVSGAENERLHHAKHVIVGREWGREMSITEYRSRAADHLNGLDADTMVELCQADDFAVVKYNVDTGELGIARRDSGLIKTFFRPNDVHYVLRKVDAGLWGEPAIAEGFGSIAQTSDFADDSQNRRLFERLEELALELPKQAHEVVTAFAESTVVASNLLLLLARLGECRFIVFELQRRILTEAQSDAVFVLRRRIVGAISSWEGLERYRSKELIEFIKMGLEDEIKKQEDCWAQAVAVIKNLEEFEWSLIERETIGYAMLELRVLQLHRRMVDVDALLYESRLRKSDLKLSAVFYQLANNFNHRTTDRISPQEFVWQRMAANLG